ncbi:uncharacterized protein LOC121778308 [Salvia splendens]|uniref:uncharacterized protein LOC121778308 n=1 Tax=Salvia splendens TaxID=180675 RepID=UPI001C25E6C9|nr:uncharacterized protein LOC121778308 [Salvia splendens]
MDGSDSVFPPAGLLTGGNAQDIGTNQPSREASAARRGIGGPRIRGDPQTSTQPIIEPGVADPVSLGFEKIMQRFDTLEFRLEATDRRVDGLEAPILPDPDLPYFSDDTDVIPHRTHREIMASDGDAPRYFNHSRRARGGDVRRRRVDFCAHPRREGWMTSQHHGPAVRRGRTYSRHGSAWDRPQTRFPQELDQGFNGYRHSTSWDPPSHRHTNNTGRMETPRDLDMKAPRFDGSDASNWISRVEYYFDHLQMADEDRLHYVVMLFQPPAAEWIFIYRANNPVITWLEFLEDVRHRFDPQSFRNCAGPLSKLVQTGSVAEYHDAFDRYLNRVQGISEEALIPIFITGLKEPIQEKVELQQPTSLAEAMALALRLASTHEECHPQQFRNKWGGRDSRFIGPSSSSVAPAATSTQQPPAQPKVTVKPGFQPIRVSNAEKAERSRKGLCYHCPEKWVPGHVCKLKVLCYIGEDEQTDGLDESDTGEDPDTVITADLSHLHTLSGTSTSRPFNVIGTIGTTTVSILIDTGSNHDFLHPRVAEQLQLSLTPIRPFRVYVGNGASLICSHIARKTKLSIQGIDFLLDLHIMEIHGPDIVLGMDWLESLGKISADFVGKTLQFSKNGVAVVLHGVQPSPRLISFQSLAMLTAHSTANEFYEIVRIEPGEQVSSNANIGEFPQDTPPAIQAVLDRFRPVFEVPTGLPPQREYDHRIHLLPHSKPINVRPYRYPYFQKNEIERQVREMLEQGIVQRSQSPFSSPVLLIRKKDGSFRFCIDYRALNMATVPDHFPIPTADELFDELGRAKFFTKLDLRSGYHQICMHGADVFKTAFRTHDGHFEFLVMPFGLTNAPSTFQAAMNGIFQPLLRKYVIVFFDDILVYSPTLEDHCSHLEQVLELLQSHQFFVKLSKCSFCSTTVEYLGHLVSDGSLKADPAKIEAMTSWPTPTTVKQLRDFLGLTGYYRRFIANYAMIAAPLTDLLKKEAFLWTNAGDAAFAALKEAMTSAPVLSLPVFDKQFCIETDASDTGIGAVLIQDKHPITYFSKKLGPRRRVASTYHKELYAIVEAVQKWRQYLLGREFIIRSDQKSLKDLLQQVVQTPDQYLYIRKLMGHKFCIEYKKGSTNKAADALSRREEGEDHQLDTGPTESCPEPDRVEQTEAAFLAAVAQPIPERLQRLREETAELPDLRALVDQIGEGIAPAHLSLVDGLIYFNRRILLSPDSKLKRLLLTEHHCTPIAGHPGLDRTFRLLSAGFYWPRMRKDVKRFVDSCAVCQSTKYSTQKPAGLLQPLPIPSQVWEDVSMDFITGLPPSKGYTTIMVVVDRLSKYAHFAPLPAKFDALRVAHLFINTVVRHHGFPRTLVSDRDSVFLNATWEEMLRLSGTKLHFSTAYHPQSDGQTEVRNRGLEQYLRAFTADCQSKWGNFLPWVELALNCFHHAALGTSPFRALYGREPPLLVASPPSAATPPKVADLIRQRGQLLSELRASLLRAQQRMCEVANKHRRHVEFEVGDLVWLKLQPYRQHSVAKPLSVKLSRRSYGPYEVLQRVGPRAAYNFRGEQTSSDPCGVGGVAGLWHDGKPTEHVLVRWSDGTDSPSWEPIEVIKRCFPTLPLEVKEAANPGGVDKIISREGEPPADEEMPATAKKTGKRTQQKKNEGMRRRDR